MNSFKNEIEYYRNLVDWGKRWVIQYCDMAVETGLDGQLVEIRDSLLFGHELAELCNPPFTNIEKNEYEYYTKKMLIEMEQIHLKGRNIAAMEYLYRTYGYSPFESI